MAEKSAGVRLLRNVARDQDPKRDPRRANHHGGVIGKNGNRRDSLEAAARAYLDLNFDGFSRNAVHQAVFYVEVNESADRSLFSL